MAKTAVEQWDTTAANNTEINSIPIDGAVTTPSQVDNIVRELMAQVAAQLGEMNFKGADIASAGTTNLATATGWYIDVTGTTTITAFGTVAAGKLFIIRFTGALTLTHNATSLILPGAANITTAAGDVAFMMSLGSGNWRCVSFMRAAGLPTIGPNSSTDNTIPRFNGTAGAIQTSGVTIDDSDLLTAANIVISNSAPSLNIGSSGTTVTAQIVRNSSVGATNISGGSSSGLGGNISLFGETHGTSAGDISLRSGTTTRLQWDQSAGDWILTGNLTVSGTITVG